MVSHLSFNWLLKQICIVPTTWTFLGDIEGNARKLKFNKPFLSQWRKSYRLAYVNFFSSSKVSLTKIALVIKNTFLWSPDQYFSLRIILLPKYHWLIRDSFVYLSLVTKTTVLIFFLLLFIWELHKWRHSFHFFSWNFSFLNISFELDLTSSLSLICLTYI